MSAKTIKKDTTKFKGDKKSGSTSKKQKQKKIDKSAVTSQDESVPNDPSFNLEDIIYLGGNQEDYDQLLSIDADEELETGLITEDKNDLKNDIKHFLEGVGFKSGETNADSTGSPESKNASTNLGVAEKSKHISTKSNANEKKTDKIKSGKKTEIDTKTDVTVFKSIEYKKYDQLLLKNSIPWYELTSNVPKSQADLLEDEINEIYSIVKQYWETEIDIYQKMKDGDRSSDAKWLRTVLTSGTLSDKVAALTMLNQESPIHCTKSLEALMNMAKKKARREALIAVDSLRHIWIADLLPDYKLRKFSEFPLEQLNSYTKTNSKEEKIKLLITMICEDHLKKTYSDFVEILQNFSKDSLSDIRNKVIGIVYELLVMKPEQEQALLSILVNKLGDPERKIASKSSYLLCELVTKHPKMKLVVIKEVERMMYRPNISDKAQYYAICFLNQIVLSHQEKDVASKLISIYFSFFKVIVSRQEKTKRKKKSASKEALSPHQTKLLSGLLTGVNRAYPYVEGMEDTYDEQLDTLFRLTHVKHLTTSVQALMLIYQVMESKQSISDRYYQALYEKLLDPDLNTSSKHTMFLNLLFKSLKNDPVLKRVKAFMKRMLQICSQDQPSLLCGILFLISEVIKTNPGINSMMQQPEDRDGEECFVDAELDKDTEHSKAVSSDEECENKDDTDINVKIKESWTFVNRDNKQDYAINQRNPLYAGAENSCIWEISPLLSHFHPSVSHFANSTVNSKEIGYKGDPSQDFTLISFLDRFMYRNPKQKEIERGHSLMQRKESHRLKEQPVNSKVFLQKSEENVPHDQLFFYRYFKQKMLDQGIKKDEKPDSYDAEIGDVEDIDFAGEVKRDGEIKKRNKNKQKEEDESGSESEIEEDVDDNFDYDNIEEELSDEEFKDNFTDKDFEDALLENLDSGGESIDNENEVGEDIDPMFAAAEDFSHLLENAGESSDGVHYKQRQWEERQEKSDWKFKKNRTKYNMKRKKDGNGPNKNVKRKKIEK